jgi:uncharacterized phage-associated protein
MTASAHTVAKFIVQKSEASTISNLKLQKLLYYVQGWHLGIHGSPVFTDEIQAWIHGPVVPAIFQTYRNFKWTPITVDATPANVDAPTSKHILAVLDAYGKLTAAQLESLSHRESPWIEARKGLDPKSPSRAVITLNSMKHFFGTLAHD